jgi:hypothetical protein
MAEPAAPTGAGAGPAAAAAAPLDEVMLAMDVVDTLRHADRLVERELGSEERDRQMKERLRQLYAAQGIDVPEHILDEGVAALREDRFLYRPPPPGLSRSLALLWINRGRWLKGLAAALAIVAAGWAGYHVAVVRPAAERVATLARDLAETLPKSIATEKARILAISRSDDASRRAAQLAGEAEAAVAAGDAAAARQRLAALTSLRQTLEQAYVLRIVSRPGEPSGVWRVPKLNPAGKNYYILVEAIDADGRPVSLAVTSEEVNRTKQVTTFGLRVDEQTFNRVRADKQDDGILQNNRFGTKEVGRLEPSFNFPTTGAAITEW